MSVNIQQVEEVGFVFSNGICETDLIDIVRPLGRIRVDPRDSELVRDIRPQSIQSAKPNTLSSRYGTNAFPFHTDTAHWKRPARYLLLYCVDPGESQRATLLQDSLAWQFGIAEEELACRALWTAGHVRPHLCMLAERIAGRLAIRYDKDCMRPMTAEARELAGIIESRIRKSNQKEIAWEPGCLLLLDNQRMVHARSASDENDGNRILKRILVGGD